MVKAPVPSRQCKTCIDIGKVFNTYDSEKQLLTYRQHHNNGKYDVHPMYTSLIQITFSKVKLHLF